MWVHRGAEHPSAQLMWVPIASFADGQINSAQTISYQPVGVVRSPYTELDGMPLQSVAAREVRGQIEIHPQFAAASPTWMASRIYTSSPTCIAGPPVDSPSCPSLTTPAAGSSPLIPRHPNPIGLSVVRLNAISGATLDITGVDLLDGTPILDIKPYVPEFDAIAAERSGWLQAAAQRVHDVRADASFDTH